MAGCASHRVEQQIVALFGGLEKTSQGSLNSANVTSEKHASQFNSPEHDAKRLRPEHDVKRISS